MLRETSPFIRQSVDLRRRRDRTAVAAEITESHVICKNEYDVGPFDRCRRAVHRSQQCDQ